MMASTLSSGISDIALSGYCGAIADGFAFVEAGSERFIPFVDPSVFLEEEVTSVPRLLVVALTLLTSSK